MRQLFLFATAFRLSLRSISSQANCNLFSSKLQFARLQTRVFLYKNYSLDIVKLPQTTFCHSDDLKGGSISHRLCEMLDFSPFGLTASGVDLKVRSTPHDKCHSVFDLSCCLVAQIHHFYKGKANNLMIVCGVLKSFSTFAVFS